MQGEMFSVVLNDDKARLIVTDVVVAALADGDALVQVIASKQRLAQGQHVAITG